MANISVSQLKTGESLQQHVYTAKGTLLFEKGRQLTGRDLEILKAFMIGVVTVTDKKEPAAESPQGAEGAAGSSPASWVRHYEEMIQFMRKLIQTVQSSGHGFPILEVRTRLEDLLRSSTAYNPLTFSYPVRDETDYLLHHSLKVALTSYQLAQWHRLPSKDWLQVALAGLLHDIGTARVDHAILAKKDKLTDSEREEVRRHTVYGYQLLKNVPALNEGVKLAALQHHEKENGGGYPLSIKGEQIHPYAKIVAIADIFHAMTNDRAYKRASSPFVALEQLFSDAFGNLDPALVHTFINRVTSLHTGTSVRLNNGRMGEIVFLDTANPTRPWVNVSGEIVNLSQERSLYILEVLSDR
ncbi:hypothetical protein J31TS4_39360 [Paenibacillus sp. J31TS4]|uniref:HD-GYP domain-containing protein n=1 Tax=Paenibacillus sp. J31TS4 TaxID=2807195 RepID=UPI001B23D9FD|nr:HD-GYP domain-containing protein [Paenibacillus sp. J31TS4]GIP40656.1 hypothetical protein J31TS4_39360 [Paenibacillus sp. J31TS4]